MQPYSIHISKIFYSFSFTFCLLLQLKEYLIIKNAYFNKIDENLNNRMECAF
jgi:hypothetical protein